MEIDEYDLRQRTLNAASVGYKMGMTDLISFGISVIKTEPDEKRKAIMYDFLYYLRKYDRDEIHGDVVKRWQKKLGKLFSNENGENNEL